MRISDWSSDVCSSDLVAWCWGSCCAGSRCRRCRACEERRPARDNQGGCRRAARAKAKKPSSRSPRGWCCPRTIRNRLAGALVPLWGAGGRPCEGAGGFCGAADDDLCGGRKGRRTGEKRSEEHTSELQSLMRISYAVFCLKKKKTNT